MEQQRKDEIIADNPEIHLNLKGVLGKGYLSGDVDDAVNNLALLTLDELYDELTAHGLVIGEASPTHVPLDHRGPPSAAITEAESLRIGAA